MEYRDCRRRQAQGEIHLTDEHLQRLASGLEELALVKADATAVRVAEDALDTRTLGVKIAVDKLDVDRLQRIIRLGIRVGLTVEEDGWELTIGAAPFEVIQIKAYGPVERLVKDDEAGALEDAIDSDDVGRVLTWLGSRPAELALTLINPPADSGFRWIATERELVARLEGDRWLGTLQKLYDRGQPETLVIADAGNGWIAAPALTVRGNEAAEAPTPTELASAAAWEWLAESRSEESALPAPGNLFPAQEGEGLADLRRALIGAARVLSWYWLAEEVDTPGPPPRVRFVGQRVVVMTLEATRSESAAAEIELWDWATKSSDAGHRRVVQEAVALAVFGPDDVLEAARPALRTAQTLLKNVRSKELAEAIATRRSTRESAITVGRAAGEAARTAGGKALERVLVQAAAAGGILIAQSRNAISDAATLRLLALIGALQIASLLLAALVDYPSARSGIKRFKDDLKLYEDTLSEKDLEDIKNMASLKDADRKITTSLWLSVSFVLAALIALVAAFFQVAEW